MVESVSNIPSALIGQADSLARQAGLFLIRDAHGYALTDGEMAVHGDFARMERRISGGNLGRELIVKAARIKGPEGPLTAVDATAGLGDDSFLLAAAGFSVKLFEHNPVIAALLQSAIKHAQSVSSLSEPAKRMHLEFGDAVQLLRLLKEPPDVVLLDPMFPERQNSAAVKKKLQLLQRIEDPCKDEEALLDAAFAACPRKVVVKRPAKGPYLAGRKPDYSLSGKAVRFDCYVLAR